jgi:hypothetical protein
MEVRETIALACLSWHLAITTARVRAPAKATVGRH